MVDRFTQGPIEAVKKLNLMVEAINTLQKMSGDSFIRVQNTPTGITFRLAWEEILLRIPKFKGGDSGVALHRAFVKTPPGSTTTLICFLDADTTGAEINVECDLFGGGNLDEAHPSFADGDPLWVAFHSGAWRNVTRIDGSEECDV